MNQAVLHSNDIECDGCASTISKLLSAMPGVSSVSVNVEEKNVNVEFDAPADIEQIKSTMQNAGFEVSA
ncbi:MAG: heavy metal-associated domain-containing protein [Fimbriimonadales bacterium]